MSIILGSDNTYKIVFQHGNLMITTPPQTYTVLPDNNIKINVEYGSYIAYIAMHNFNYSSDNLNEFAEQIQNIIKLKLNTVQENSIKSDN